MSINAFTSVPGLKVLLIGGCGDVGKTTVASVIARRQNVSFGQVDDFRLALQRITSPAKHPGLHFFISSPGVAKEKVFGKPPEILRDALINVGKVVCQALEVVIAHHIAVDIPIILEGDGILPSLATKSTFAGIVGRGQVRSVFLYETDEDFFFSRIRQRENELDSLRLKEEWTATQMNWLYGQWLVKEAERLRLPIVPARPWETLPDRILTAIELNQAPLTD